MAVFFTIAGIVVSEMERRPRKPSEGALQWSLLLLLVLGGLYWRRDRDRELHDLATFVCFLTQGFGWFLQLTAMQKLGRIFHLRFDVCGAKESKGEKVVRVGPYSIIRHPGYASLLCCFPPAAYLTSNFNHYYFVLVFGLMFGLYGYVIANVEEKKLLIKSRDYKQYMEDVPYRLIPFVY